MNYRFACLSQVLFAFVFNLCWNNSDAFGQPADEAGFQSIFNGKDLDRWKGEIDNYHVVDGSIVCKQGQGGVIYFDEEYTDFCVRLEFLLPPGGNNGLAIRYPGYGRASVDAMCELQVLDDDAPQYQTLDPRQFHGSMYGMAAARKGFLKPVGQWNQQEVTVQGRHIRVVLNGETILDVDSSTLKDFKDDTEHPGKDRLSGFFGFAGHRDPVQFRNIRIKRLDPYRLSRFRADVTIPLNHRCMGVLPQKSKSISDPLMLHGFIVSGPEKPIVVAAIDWCEIRNGSYDQWRDRLAEAAGTERDRVLLSSLHQHDAPVIDADAQALLDKVGLQDELFDPEFHEATLQRVQTAVRDSLSESVPISHVGYAETVVRDVASNRRIVDSQGKVTFVRGSSTGRDQFLKDTSEGLIDSKMRTLSFWNNENCLLEYHSYATHPMSYYGRGEVSADFVGLARERRQRDDQSVQQIYASGCSGDVTAGKYNDGTQESRLQLIQKIYEAMVKAREQVTKTPMAELRFKKTDLALEFSREQKLAPQSLKQELEDSTLPTERRILAAMGLASSQRVNERKQPITFPCIDFGNTKLVLFPGESFVGYQHMAQELSPDYPVIPVGYGESWTGYVPTESAFADGFNESWLWVAPGSESKLKAALKSVLTR